MNGLPPPPPAVYLTMPDECPLCIMCHKEIGPLNRWLVGADGHKVHAKCYAPEEVPDGA